MDRCTDSFQIEIAAHCLELQKERHTILDSPNGSFLTWALVL